MPGPGAATAWGWALVALPSTEKGVRMVWNLSEGRGVAGSEEAGIRCGKLLVQGGHAAFGRGRWGVETAAGFFFMRV